MVKEIKTIVHVGKVKLKFDASLSTFDDTFTVPSSVRRGGRSVDKCSAPCGSYI